eukprot:CAMPEP_0177181354 /NCGR_PEP_ID=MMETSP0367-20130122/15880_1 /TAXON_ID=447022 ORGANISM="Scrippsiella hangoei-like, Strain SHHI-4" /NCGR_SAMPLE_ID=MMETSP0367 /ASSEMBLY_ACC=CAM_ASM_000362 /LENGTH=347 /DNA_ID=CAMNT_0018628199 /DNA_START=49 /DNA_END=1092 /DNA_ORIENTATION=+
MATPSARVGSDRDSMSVVGSGEPALPPSSSISRHQGMATASASSASDEAEASWAGASGSAAEVHHAPASRPAVRANTLESTKSVLWKAVSAWRLPIRPGEMPLYVQRRFRKKAYGLLSIQLGVLLLITLTIKLCLPDHLGTLSLSRPREMISFYTLGFTTVFALFFLQSIADRYPWNYIALISITVLVGIFWGLAPNMFNAMLHVQVLGILFVSTIGNTIIVQLLTRETVQPWHALIISNVASWSVAAVVSVVITQHLGLCSLAWSMVAAVIALLLLFLALFVGAGAHMVRCNPDSFLQVVVAMDCALLVVTTPMFIVSSFLFCMAAEPETENQGEVHVDGVDVEDP